MEVSRTVRQGRDPEALAVVSGVEIWKRTLDLALLGLFLPVWAPLMGCIVLVIEVVSPGAILFRQERVGYRGRRFVCLKFRTMRPDADPAIHRTHLSRLMRSDGPMTKLDLQGDPRLIACGALLRATGLDELPQIFNVLRGEMSLVGPRPSLPYEFDHYCVTHREHLETFRGLTDLWQIVGHGPSASAPPACVAYQADQYCYKERAETLPGLTGLWQVQGKNRTTFAEMMRLDVHYARHRSLGLDLKIILKTIPALLTQLRDLRARKRRRPQGTLGNCPAGRLDRAHTGGDS